LRILPLRTKFILCAFALLGAAVSARAQNSVSLLPVKGAWEFEPFVGGGTGLGKSSNTQFLIVGGRAGKILTGEHLRGWAQGNFELATEVMPLYLVMQPGGAVYGGSFKPLIFKWNFKGNGKIAPYALITGGVLFTTSNVPPGNTSDVNFTPQGALGFYFFRRRKRAWDFEIQAVHTSNASLGHLNPGFNGSLIFTLGYSWFK